MEKNCLDCKFWEDRSSSDTCVNCYSLEIKNPSANKNNNGTQYQIDILFDNFKEFLKEKNRRYGDSALDPLKIFSKTDAGSQICNRIDDKLGRIKNSKELKKNDLCDLFGYVALLLIEKGFIEFDDLID